MYLMYYDDEEGNRVYTMQVTLPVENVLRRRGFKMGAPF